ELAVDAAVHQLLDLVEIDAGAATVAMSGYEACDIGEGGFELAGRMYEYAFIAAGAAQCEQGLEVSDQPRLDADTGHRYGHTKKERELLGHCPLVVNPVQRPRSSWFGGILKRGAGRQQHHIARCHRPLAGSGTQLSRAFGTEGEQIVRMVAAAHAVPCRARIEARRQDRKSTRL